jgi:hypothetical protein
MNGLRSAATGATLVLAAGHALAHPGHGHDDLAASVLHLLFGLHAWPTLFAWGIAVAGAAAVGALALRLTRVRLRRVRPPARSPGTPRQAT